MVELLLDILAFALKAGLVTLAAVVSVGAVALIIANLRRGRDGPSQGHLELRHLNKRLRRVARQVERAGLGHKAEKAALKAARKADKQAEKARAKAAVKAIGEGVAASQPAAEGARSADEPASGAAMEATIPAGVGKPRVFVLDFDGDLQARRVRQLREEITALLGGTRPGDEVLLRLNSPGGSVTGYGLAASQLARLSAAKIPLTVAVDQVAASGGYMMAVVADRILAAPFAMVGSIGVVATVPNVRRLLQKHDVDVEQVTAGRYKRTLSLVGENTDEGRARFKEDLEAIHAQFKAHVARFRPQANVDEVATGEHWTADRAVALGLVDELLTSDDWLLARQHDAEIIEVRWEPPRTVRRRLGLAVEDVLVGVGERLWARLSAGWVA